MKLYAEREIDVLDGEGGFYTAHINAMTVEGLNSKSAIAAELAYRDSLIVKLEARIKELESDVEWLELHIKC